MSETHLSKLHRHRHGRQLKSFAKTLLLYLTTAFLEVYFSLPYIDLADKTLTKEMKRNWSVSTSFNIDPREGTFGFFLTDSLVAIEGCFVDESLVEQLEAGERTFYHSHLPQDEPPLRVDMT